MWVCMSLRIFIRSLGVGVYVSICLQYMSTEFQSLHGCVYTFTCVWVYIYVYTNRVYMCVCMYSRTCTQSLRGGGFIDVYVHRVCMWVCIYSSTYTQSLHVCVYGFTYIHTKVVCVRVYIYVYHTESTCGGCVFLRI